MLTYSQAFYDLVNSLQPLYDQHEATAIAHEVLAHITGLDKLQRLMQKETSFTTAQQEQYERMHQELLQGRPLQYVIGEAWFMGRPYKVDENVLIPRPETEELVQWIIDDSKDKKDLSILDIGTGSGCIPVSLKLALPVANVTTCDISTGALGIAVINAAQLAASIQILHLDFLDQKGWAALPAYDIIVSNPPYIPLSEKQNLHRNVSEYEPAQALFVPDEDPLVFYKAIAAFGKTHLNTNGTIYCELHLDHVLQTKTMFEAAGYKDVTIRNDMHGNLRMLKVT